MQSTDISPGFILLELVQAIFKILQVLPEKVFGDLAELALPIHLTSGHSFCSETAP